MLLAYQITSLIHRVAKETPLKKEDSAYHCRSDTYKCAWALPVKTRRKGTLLRELTMGKV